MTEPNPYSDANPYMSDDMTGGTDAGGGAGQVPKSTKPRQEPSGSKMPDPADLMMQMQQTMMQPGMGAGMPPGGAGAAPAPQGDMTPASPGVMPPAGQSGAIAMLSDSMVRYVLAHNPEIGAKEARQLAREAILRIHGEDYTAPHRMREQHIPTLNVLDMADEYAKHRHQKRQKEWAKAFQQHLKASDAAHAVHVRNGGAPISREDFYTNVFSQQNPHPLQHQFRYVGGPKLPAIKPLTERMIDSLTPRMMNRPPANPGKGGIPTPPPAPVSPANQPRTPGSLPKMGPYSPPPPPPSPQSPWGKRPRSQPL